LASAGQPSLDNLGRQFSFWRFYYCLSSAVFAQLNTADILGTVTDATGAVVPSANVILTNLGTNETRTGHSNSSGDYSFALLPVGHYTSHAELAALASLTRPIRPC
jgi:hypothetical protein